jgi:hypothetical protein
MVLEVSSYGENESHTRRIIWGSNFRILGPATFLPSETGLTGLKKVMPSQPEEHRQMQCYADPDIPEVDISRLGRL